MRLKVVYIISDINKALAFEWIARSLNRNDFDLSFILIGLINSQIGKALREEGCEVVEIELPNKLQLPGVFFKVLLLLLKWKPRVVHTHLFYANLIGLLAARILFVPKRILTRHHAMTHYHEFIEGRKWDLFSNALATQIVAISQNTQHILSQYDRAKSSKIILIHHGFDLDYFQNVENDRIRFLRDKYKITTSSPVVGVVARYLDWKGIQYVIPAFKKLREEYPNAHLLLANAKGNYERQIKEALVKLPEGSFTEILFEEDMAALYQLMDIYVHTPTDAESEAFGQTYVEALAAGIPSVFTLSGVAPEFIVHDHNALVVPFRDSKSITDAIRRILMDDELRQVLIENGKKSSTLFPIEKMLHSLETLYNL